MDNKSKNPLPHFGNWISAGNVLQLVAMAVGGLWVLAQMNSAIAVQNERITTQRDQTAQNITRLERQASEDRAEMLKEIRELRVEVRQALINGARR